MELLRSSGNKQPGGGGSQVKQRPRPIVIVGATLLIVGLAGLVASGLIVLGGVYNVSALRQHTAPVYALIDLSLRSSIRLHARHVEPPDLAPLDWRNEGLRLYAEQCLQCHGAPGTSPESFALSLTPVPTAMVETARKRSAGQLFWVIEQGIKMSGMPGWKYRLTDREIWSIVAFLKQMPHLTVAEYRRLALAAGVPQPPAGPPVRREATTMPPSAAEGHRLIQQYGCVSCHTIPGVTGATAHVGPPLAGIASRTFIAGLLPNTRDNMVRWLHDPQGIDPLSMMPSQGVSEQEAAHIAAYLATLTADR